MIALVYGLTNGTSALAAPPGAGSKPTDNPFEAAGQDNGDKGDNQDNDDATPATDAHDDAAASQSREESAGDNDDESGEEAESAESALHGLACLEGDATGGRRKGVQRRDFLKKHRFELSGLGGFYASDALSSTYSYGGAVAFYPSEDFGLEFLLTRTPMQFRLEQPFTAFDQQTHFSPTVAWQGIASLLWSPIHAKFKFSDTTIIHGDLFAIVGAGRTGDPSVLGLTWEAGVGAKLYFNRFFAFRLDLRDFLLPQEVLGRGRITNNVTVLAGLSLWLG
ncbi:MAG TPA: outer membrane beta-barrel domain-containing protein [Polyangia bacterium]|nr:outer membrane beta-barrel domain-containing protein [Polyangia bacterium]